MQNLKLATGWTLSAFLPALLRLVSKNAENKFTEMTIKFGGYILVIFQSGSIILSSDFKSRWGWRTPQEEEMFKDFEYTAPWIKETVKKPTNPKIAEEEEEMDPESKLDYIVEFGFGMLIASPAAEKHAAFVRARGRHYSNEAEAMKVRIPNASNAWCL